MSKVIFCRGIQGSGKSTWAKNWVAEKPKERIRINWDDMRNMFGPYWVPEREKLLEASSKKILLEALLLGYDVVIDNMNLSEKSTKGFLDTIKRWEKTEGNHMSAVSGSDIVLKCEIEYKDFKTPLEECIARDAKREHPIGAGIITATYNKHKEFYN